MAFVMDVKSIIDRLTLEIGYKTRHVYYCHTFDATVSIVIDSRFTSAVATFMGAADSVAAVLARTTDWGPSGIRDGQYTVDVVADRVCIDVLYAAGYRVLSEESGLTGPQGSEASMIVVVDPIDGSTNASRHVPWFASAFCLVDADGPAVGVVANHSTGERFVGIRGLGAERDGQAITVSNAQQLERAILGVSGLPTHHYGWAQFRALGASAPDICAVACGVTDAWCDMTDSGHGVWDYLASSLILTEAGGVIREVFDRELCVLDHLARRSPVAAANSVLLNAVMTERRSP